MAFRAIGSTIFRASSLRGARPVMSSMLRIGSPTSAQNLRMRALATEAGFLDKDKVTERVLEVVRKFEKVGHALTARSKIKAFRWLSYLTICAVIIDILS